MHETDGDFARLQQVLDQSFESAGEHLKSIQSPELRLTPTELSETLTGVCILDLATVNSVSAPFVAPVDGLFLRGNFWFSSADGALKIRHIRQNPTVSAAYTVGQSLSVLIHGIAHEVDTSKSGYEHVGDYCLEVYGPTYADWGYFGKAPFVWIEPVKMFASRLPSGE
jgi:hypothetical protein